MRNSTWAMLLGSWHLRVSRICGSIFHAYFLILFLRISYKLFYMKYRKLESAAKEVGIWLKDPVTLPHNIKLGAAYLVIPKTQIHSRVRHWRLNHKPPKRSHLTSSCLINRIKLPSTLAYYLLFLGENDNTISSRMLRKAPIFYNGINKILHSHYIKALIMNFAVSYVMWFMEYSNAVFFLWKSENKGQRRSIYLQWQCKNMYYSKIILRM